MGKDRLSVWNPHFALLKTYCNKRSWDMTYAHTVTHADSCMIPKHWVSVLFTRTTVKHDVFCEFSAQTCAVDSWQPPWERSNRGGGDDLGPLPLLTAWWEGINRKWLYFDFGITVLLYVITMFQYLFTLKRRDLAGQLLVLHDNVFVFNLSHTLTPWPVNVSKCTSQMCGEFSAWGHDIKYWSDTVWSVCVCKWSVCRLPCWAGRQRVCLQST